MKSYFPDVFNLERKENPYLMGDVFRNSSKDTFTFFSQENDVVYGINQAKDSTPKFTKFRNIVSMLDQGFEPDLELIEKSKEIREYDLYAPRLLNDGVWAALHPLAFTTSICVDFDLDNATKFFDSRYCFPHTEMLPSWLVATYLLSQFKNKSSLPVGNCAYRGKLGNDPIYSESRTKAYYQALGSMKDGMLINGMDVNHFANREMMNIFKESMRF